jgi:hypothetical protein
MHYMFKWPSIELFNPFPSICYTSLYWPLSTPEVHKILARVQCTVQVCELAVSNLHPPPYCNRQIICLSHSESVRLPLQLPMRPSPHQLHAGLGHSIPCTCAQHSSTHHCTLCTACPPLVYALGVCCSCNAPIL